MKSPKCKDMLLNGITSGEYRHYKGGHYEVIGLAYHSETHEELVVYRSLMSSEEYPVNTMWVRPIEMFFEEIEFNGATVLRFTPI